MIVKLIGERHMFLFSFRYLRKILPLSKTKAWSVSSFSFNKISVRI